MDDAAGLTVKIVPGAKAKFVNPDGTVYESDRFICDEVPWDAVYSLADYEADEPIIREAK